MPNVLDIGQFAEDTGFITSSDDEGDGFQKAAKSNLGYFKFFFQTFKE